MTQTQTPPVSPVAPLSGNSANAWWQPRSQSRVTKKSKKIVEYPLWLVLMLALAVCLSLGLFLWQVKENAKIKNELHDQQVLAVQTSVICDQATVMWTQIDKDWQNIEQDLLLASHAALSTDNATARELTSKVNTEISEVTSAVAAAQAKSNSCAHPGQE